MSQQEAELLPSFIIDFGRGFIKYKSEFPGDDGNISSSAVSEDTPISCCETRNVIAMMKNGDPDEGPKYMIDLDLRKSNRYAKIHYPLKGGHLTDWNVFEKMIDCLARDSRVYLEETRTIMSYGPHMTESEKIKVTDIMFEKFNVPEFGLILDDSLAAIGSDKIYGTMLDCGYKSTRAVPIFDGVPLIEFMTELNFGGHDLVMHFLKLLEESGLHTINSSYVGDREYFGPFCLEKYGYIPLDYEKEVKEAKFNKVADLYDLRSVPLNNSVFTCTQAMFDPSLVGLEEPSVHNLIMQSIEKCDEDKRHALSDVIPCGGNSNLNGFFERLGKELKIVSQNSSFTPKLSEMKNRTKLPLIGGSIVSKSATLFDKFSMKMEDYNEFGESHQKKDYLTRLNHPNYFLISFRISPLSTIPQIDLIESSGNSH